MTNLRVNKQLTRILAVVILLGLSCFTYGQDIRYIPIVYHDVVTPSNIHGIQFGENIWPNLDMINSVYANTWHPWDGSARPQDVGVDTQIQFFVATSDVNGDPRFGLVTDYFSKESFDPRNSGDVAEVLNFPSMSYFPNDKYLHIFVAFSMDAGQGYCEPPFWPQVAMRSSGLSTYPVAAHEIGHWLNVQHQTVNEYQMNYKPEGNDLTPLKKSCYFTQAHLDLMNNIIVNYRQQVVHSTQVFSNRDLNETNPENLYGKLTANNMEIDSKSKAKVPDARLFRVKTNSEIIGSLKHIKWNSEQGHYTMSRQINYSGGNRPTDEMARFSPTSPVNVNISVDGIPVNGSVDVKDPWYVTDETNAVQPNEWRSYENGYAQDVFLNQSIPPTWAAPYYSVGTLPAQTLNLNGGQALCYFQNWLPTNAILESDIALQTKVRYEAAGASVLASYKAPLRTGTPSLADSKNQRRAVSSGTGGTTCWYLVYESMGDIWLAYSADNGNSWFKEERLNVIRGNGSNPTISNVFSFGGGDVSRVMISWIELNGSVYECHLQTMTIAQYQYGWLSQNTTRNSNNHKLLSEWNVPAARMDSRPILRLDQNGTDVIVTFAIEGASTGIISGRRRIPGNGVNYVGDLSDAVRYDGIEWCRTLSTQSGDSNPVIITYPSAYGYPARSCVYYLAVGYAPGRRVVQYDYATTQTTVLPAAYADYTYSSLQGGVNTGGASFALVADAYDGGGNHNVNYYQKPTYYGASAPTLQTSYSGVRQPTLMVENVGGFGTPTVEINLVSQAQTTWYKANGSPGLTSFGNGTAGIFTREQVPSGNRMSIPTRSSVSPAQLYAYSGTGSLSKSSGDLAVDLCAVRFWSTDGVTERPLILDFSGAEIKTLDSLESGQVVCAVQIITPSANGMLVQQADSLAVPLQVDLVRSGKTINSFALASWKSLTSQSIPQFAPGDILKFKLSGAAKRTRGYLQVSLRGNGIQKLDLSNQKTDALQLTPNSIVAYPNPFNPSTQLSYQLSEISFVKLVVYDVLGREVAQLVNGMSEAGSHSVVWDASGVSSGVYYARLTVADDSNNPRANRVSRLLLVK